MNNNEWLNDRVKYLKGLKSRNEQQEWLVLLAEKPNRNAQEDKKLNAIIRAEKASLRATKARQEAANLINAEKRRRQRRNAPLVPMNFVTQRVC